MLDALLAAECQRIHERAAVCARRAGSDEFQQHGRSGEGYAQSTASAPRAMALITSLPVRMPESMRTVNLPAACASRTFGLCMIWCSA